LKKGAVELESVADLGDVEEGTPADVKVRADASKLFADVGILQKKLQQLEDKVETTPVANKKPRKTPLRQAQPRQGGSIQSIRRCPFRTVKWKEFSREIERAVDEISHIDSEIKKLETRNNPVQQARLKEFKREIKKREQTAGASLPDLRHSMTVSAMGKRKPSAPRKTWWRPTFAWWYRSPRST